MPQVWKEKLETEIGFPVPPVMEDIAAVAPQERDQERIAVQETAAAAHQDETAETESPASHEQVQQRTVGQTEEEPRFAEETGEAVTLVPRERGQQLTAEQITEVRQFWEEQSRWRGWFHKIICINESMSKLWSCPVHKLWEKIVVVNLVPRERAQQRTSEQHEHLFCDRRTNYWCIREKSST